MSNVFMQNRFATWEQVGQPFGVASLDANGSLESDQSNGGGVTSISALTDVVAP